MSKNITKSAVYTAFADMISASITTADYAQLDRQMRQGEIGQNDKGVPYWCIRAVYLALGYARQAQYALANLENRMKSEAMAIQQIEDRAKVNGTDPVNEDLTFLDRTDRLASMQEEERFHRDIFRACTDSITDLTGFALESLLEPVRLATRQPAESNRAESRAEAAQRAREAIRNRAVA